MVQYTDYEREQIAREEYSDKLFEGKEIVIDSNHLELHIGTVTKIYDDRQSGLRTIVVKDSAVA